jgi:ectoine hydroxylase-related dioxygenase (phytanoyl-CoA dioxygenase family)
MTSLELSDGQISEFWECGYVAVPAITSQDEVILMRRVFERLFAERAGREEGAQFDMVTHDEDDEPARLPAIISPVNFAPELRHTRYRANARAIARQLLGSTATAAFEHAILKPAQRGAATPWHQDEATRVDSNFVYEQVSIWMPLQEATIENGCMHYIPGSHKGDVLDHRSPKSDRKVHAIECAGEFDPSAATPCPLPAGGAVIHHGRTLHCAGPNSTNNARFAYILAFEIPPVPLAGGRDFYWNREKETANRLRRSAWRKRGGVVIELVRRARYGALGNPKRMLFEVRRAMRALLQSK